MKGLLFAIVICSSLVTNAQTSVDIQIDFFKFLGPNVIILTEDGLIRETTEVKAYASKLKEAAYTKTYTIEVNSSLEYEIVELKTNSNIYSVMFVKSTVANNQLKIEFINIYKKSKTDDNSSQIDKFRKEWMSFCNSHQADKLVKQLYTPDAYYYNRGRLIQGTKSLTAEYSYMNMPSYSLTLTPKHMVAVNSDIVYEIGQCSGSYPLPYMLVWEKQEDGKWQILMDSNY